MKIFFDTEFTQLIKNTSLISIGLKSEDDKLFYAENTEYNKDLVDDWIEENVIKNCKYLNDGKAGNIRVAQHDRLELVGDMEVIRKTLLDWLNQFDKVEWVSDVFHYDFVLLIDSLCGHGLKVPSNMCIACHDINQDIARYYGVDEITASDKSREEILSEHGVVIKGEKHNSLYDAEVIKEIYYIVNKEV